MKFGGGAFVQHGQFHFKFGDADAAFDGVLDG
jgi:hypothetical protein